MVMLICGRKVRSVHSEESRKYMSAIRHLWHLNHPDFASENSKGRVLSQVSRKRISDSVKSVIREGRCSPRCSDEHYKKLSIMFSGSGNPMYGKKLSIETRRKMSASHTGKHVGKLNNFYGMHHTAESKRRIVLNHVDVSGDNNPMKRFVVRQKVSNSMQKLWSVRQHPFLGRHHTVESRLKMSKSKLGKCVGSDNPNWRGGYKKRVYLAGFSRFKKFYVRNFYNNVCMNCGKKGGSLPVHHIDYGVDDNSFRNLIPLCRSCHNLTLVRDSCRREILRIHFSRLVELCLADDKVLRLYCGGDAGGYDNPWS